jgi:hypothetical protein
VDADETHALGYERVDDDPNVSILLGTMEATGRWEAPPFDFAMETQAAEPLARSAAPRA